jgi:hypothetical protein
LRCRATPGDAGNATFFYTPKEFAFQVAGSNLRSIKKDGDGADWPGGLTTNALVRALSLSLSLALYSG